MGHDWNPMRDLMTLQDRMNRLFEEAARRRSGGGGATEADDETEAEMERADWHPAADVFEDEKGYIIILDVPGIDREALDVSLNDDRLTIKGERAALTEGGTRRRSERPSGRFLRSFSLPAIVDREGITADYKDGVLRLRLPKRTEQHARRVEIKVS
ncbi:MAG TPA: Hsp20/alpha crystallin family protein [Pyrinomonadaceae bacterium]|jgi:HSP20 family protein